MKIFGNSGQQPSEAFASEEQNRADNLVQRIDEIASDPARSSSGVLPHFQAAYRNASENAAANTAQPKS